MPQPETSESTQAASDVPVRINRMGRFTVTGRLLCDWKQLLPLMGKMVVVRCEYHYASDRVEYVAYSELFDEVPEYCEPPRYDIECMWNGDEVIIQAHKSKEP